VAILRGNALGGGVEKICYIHRLLSCANQHHGAAG